MKGSDYLRAFLFLIIFDTDLINNLLAQVNCLGLFIMTTEERDRIVAAIKSEVEIEDKASARVGYHAEVILQKKPVPYNVLSKIEAKVIQDKKYLSRPHPKIHGDYEIYKDPHWKKETTWRKYPFIEKVLLVIIAGSLGLLSTLIVTRQTKLNQRQKDFRQDSLLKDISDSFKSIQRLQVRSLERSVAIADSQLRVQADQAKYSQRPILTVTELSNDFLGEAMIMSVSIENSGGDLNDLSYTSIKGAKVDAASFPAGKQIPSLGMIHLSVLNIKEDRSGVRLSFRDNLMNRYTQEMIWIKREGQFYLSFGALKSVKK